MNAVVVYESLYGNTHEIAKAVADGLRSGGEATVLSVADASGERLAGAELVVVGGPTHVHGMASRLSRKGAADDARKKGHELPDIEGPALRDWFDGLPKADGTPAATFDTRIDKPRFVTGSAAKGHCPAAPQPSLLRRRRGELPRLRLRGAVDRRGARPRAGMGAISRARRRRAITPRSRSRSAVSGLGGAVATSYASSRSRRYSSKAARLAR
jgi:hypothetical protein